ncbi:MAG: hypothetical protein H6732_17430 [Alphaproteobacteria bacterium]|nr:hypothetical protein [Alphaproteobacteria bacterium]
MLRPWHHAVRAGFLLGMVQGVPLCSGFPSSGCNGGCTPAHYQVSCGPTPPLLGADGCAEDPPDGTWDCDEEAIRQARFAPEEEVEAAVVRIRGQVLGEATADGSPLSVRLELLVDADVVPGSPDELDPDMAVTWFDASHLDRFERQDLLRNAVPLGTATGWTPESTDLTVSTISPQGPTESFVFRFDLLAVTEGAWIVHEVVAAVSADAAGTREGACVDEVEIEQVDQWTREEADEDPKLDTGG